MSNYRRRFNEEKIIKSVIITYNITDISTPTKIRYYSNNNHFIKCTIDGVVQSNIPEYYQFNNIGEHIIEYNLSINSLYPTIENASKYLGDFYQINTIKKVILSDDFTSTAQWFRACNNLEEINLEKLINIGPYSFADTKLNGILNINVKYIGIEAFFNTKYNKIILPDIINLYGNGNDGGCFHKMNNLTYVDLGEHLKKCESHIFHECNNLQTLICRATTPPISEGKLLGYGERGTIYVPDESIDLYKSASGWSQYASRIKGISQLPTIN